MVSADKTMIDVLIVATFLLCTVCVGIYTGRNIKTIKDYISYYKKYNPTVLGLSLIMVIFGSGTIVGGIVETYNVGIIYAIASLGYVANSIISAKFIIPRMQNQFNGMVTVCDIFRKFYGEGAEKLSAAIAVVFDVGAMSSQLIN